MRSYRQLRAELLENKKTKRAYENFALEFAFVRMIIQKRLAKGLTQKELAEKVGTKQSAISRFESGTYNPTLSFLEKVASALGTKVSIALQ